MSAWTWYGRVGNTQQHRDNRAMCVRDVMSRPKSNHLHVWSRILTQYFSLNNETWSLERGVWCVSTFQNTLLE